MRATAYTSSGSSRAAAWYMAARQDQKSLRPGWRTCVRPRMARWKEWPWAETSPGRSALPGRRTRSKPGAGSPTATTAPPATERAAPACTPPPATSRSGR